MSATVGAESSRGKGLLLRTSALAVAVLAASSAATQFIAYRVGYHPTIGTPIVGHFYAPWSWLAWRSAPWAASVPQTFHIVDASLFGLTAVAAFGGLALGTSLRRRPKRHAGVHGTARFQDEADIRRSGLLPQAPGAAHAGVYVGGFTDAKGRTHYMRHDGPEL